MVCTAGSSGVRRPPWEVLPSRRPIVQRPSADCEDDPEPGTRTSRKKGLAQGAAIRRHHHALLGWNGRGSRRQAAGREPVPLAKVQDGVMRLTAAELSALLDHAC